MDIPVERHRFNRVVAPCLAAAAVPGAQPEDLPASTRFAYFGTSQQLVMVGGVQEAKDSGLALAYGLTLRGTRRLTLVLPRQFVLATQQRVPFLKKPVQPDVFIHDVPLHGVYTGSPVPLPSGTRDQAVGTLLSMLPGQDPHSDLTKAGTSVHFGSRSVNVAELSEWATKHPLLDPGHRKGERAWHCAGQKVLSIRGASSKALLLRAGIHFTDMNLSPPPVVLGAGQPLSSDGLQQLQSRVQDAIHLRLESGREFHRPDEHWLQSVIRRSPQLVGVEQPAMREVPAWRPGGGPNGQGWGRGYVDLIGVDASGDLRLVETKLAKNPDDLFIFQGLDYYVWARAWRQALATRLALAAQAQIVVHYVLGATQPGNQSHVSQYAQAQAQALDIPWRSQIVRDWFTPPMRSNSQTDAELLPEGSLPT